MLEHSEKSGRPDFIVGNGEMAELIRSKDWSQSALGPPSEPPSRARASETPFLENQRMFLTRNGYLEETFFTVSLSPIRNESDGIRGLFHPVTETTNQPEGARHAR